MLDLVFDHIVSTVKLQVHLLVLESYKKCLRPRGRGEGYEYKSRHIFFIQDTLSQPLMKIFPTVFKIEGIVALIIKRRELRKYKGESCHSCTRHIVKTCLS